MNYSTFHNIYFLGIGGIGMSALARYFRSLGKNVGGYDRTSTPLTVELESEGMSVHYTDAPGDIPPTFRNSPETLVIYTPAIPRDHSELNYFRSNAFTILKRSEVLGAITGQKKTIAVAGTHGKTTVSTLIAHIFNRSDYGCNAFLGGISKNYNSNLLLSATSDFMIVEADEFDRSFLQLYPDLAVITSADADHLDIYGSIEQMRSSFYSFMSQVKNGGKLLIKEGVNLNKTSNKNISVHTYSLTVGADFYVENLKLENGLYNFDVVTPSGILSNMTLGIPGIMNVENAVAATAVAYLTGIGAGVIREALRTFSGVKRRFDYQVQSNDMVYIDDYAHHPEELKACITSARKIYPGKKITGIFQPHLYSRTRDLAEEFALSLGLLDELILLDIYPARELPIEGVSSKIIFDKVMLEHKVQCTMQQLPELLKTKKIEVLLTLGAGDIDTMTGPIKKILTDMERQ